MPWLVALAVAFLVIRLTGIRPGPLFVFAAGAIALLWTLARPDIGLYALIFNFVNEFDSYYRLQRIIPISLPILFDLAVGIAVLRHVILPGRIPRLAYLQNFLLSGYVLLVCFSTVVSDFSHPYLWVNFRTLFLIRPIIYLVLLLIVRSRGDLYRLLVVILLAESIVMAGAMSDYLQKGGGAYRVRGTVGAINYLSYVCIVTIPILISIVAYLRDRIPRAIMFGFALVTLFVALQTLSRSGFYSLLVTLGFITWRFARRPRLLVVATVFALIFYQLIPPALTARLGEVEDITQTSRWALSKVSLNMALDNPLLGVGWGAYEANFLRYDRDQTFTSSKAPHSNYLYIAAASGFPALALYLLTFGVTFWQLSRLHGAYRRAGETRAFGYFLTVGVEGGLVGHLVFGLAGTYGDSYYAYMLLGLAVVILRLHPARGPFRPVLP